MEKIALKFLAALILFLLSQTVSHAVCPDGFQHHRNSRCYKVFSIPSSWMEAKMYCRVYGADLAAIKTSEEMSIIKGILATVPDAAEFFIDGSDALAENDWRWMGEDGNSYPLTYTHWAPNEPDNFGASEHCMEVYPSNDKFWGDVSCQSRRGFICEVSYVYMEGPYLLRNINVFDERIVI